MLQKLLILILNFIYLFSFLVTIVLIITLINGLLLFFSYEDNVFFYSEDYRDEQIDRLDYIYEQVFEQEIDLYEFRADEVLRSDFKNIELYAKESIQYQNNFDDFHGYINNRTLSTLNYFEISVLTKLFFNNEALILFFIIFIYNAVTFLNFIVVCFLFFYATLFLQYNGFFNFKKFKNLNSTLKSDKGFLNYNLTQLDTNNDTVDLTDFVGSADHFLLTQQTKNPLYNNNNYYINDYSKQNLILLLNNNLDLNLNYLVTFLSTDQTVNLTLNQYLLNFLIYQNIAAEWKKTLPKTTLLSFENNEAQNRVEPTTSSSALNPFTTFITDRTDKKLLFFKNNNFLIANKTLKRNSTDFLEKKISLNFNKTNCYLVDSSTELLKGAYSSFYNCNSDLTYDNFFNAFELFLKLNDKSFYLSKVTKNQLIYLPRVLFVPNTLLKQNYLVKDKFYYLYYFNSFGLISNQFYINDYFNFFSIINLQTNSSLPLTVTKKINIILAENFLTNSINKKKLTEIWTTLSCNSANLINTVKSSVTYRDELRQIFNHPFHNKFYLKLYRDGDLLKLKIYEFLFSLPVMDFFVTNFSNVTKINTNLAINKNKFLKQVFKKFFKFDFVFKLKFKKLNKSFLTKKKIFYYFWVILKTELKKLFNEVNVKTTAFNYLFFDKKFLNFFKSVLNTKKQINELNIMLVLFLSPFEDCFYKSLNSTNFDFYFNSILTNPYYQKLKSNYLNFDNWVEFFNSINVPILTHFLNLEPNKIVSSTDFNLNNVSQQTDLIFLNHLNATSINFSKLFFLKNLYKRLFFENKHYKFDEINNFADYSFYLQKIFSLIFKFELNGVLKFICCNDLFGTKLTYQFKQNKKLTLIRNHILIAEYYQKYIPVPKNDYTAMLLNSLWVENSYMYHNFYNLITNYHIYNCTKFPVLDKTVNLLLLKKLNINLFTSLPSTEVKLSQLINKVGFFDFIVVLNYVTGRKVEPNLTAASFYSDNILNMNSVGYESFVWVDNEEDVLTYMPEDGILLEDNVIDNEFDEDGYAELGSIEYSLELDSDLAEDNFKKSLKDDYGYNSFFPYKIKKFTERFLFFNYFKELITFKDGKIYLPYHPNWFYLIFNFLKLILTVVVKNLYYFFSYKIFIVISLIFIFIFLT